MTQTTRMLWTLAAAVVVAAGAGSYAYFGVFAAEREERARKEAEERLVGLEADAVEKLTLVARGATTVLEKGDEGWRLVEPVAAPADQGAVESLLRRLAEAKRRRQVDDADLAKFGLDDPAVVVTAFGKGGAHAELALGRGNQFDGSLFVRDGAGGVATAEASLRDALEKRPFDLRDKRLVVVGADRVEGLEVEGRFSLERRSDSWHLVDPVEERADDPAADDYLRSLQDLRAIAFAAEEPADLAAFGLDQPALQVRVALAGGGATELAFGRVDERLYARAGAGPVAEIRASAFEDLDKSSEDLRDKRVLLFDKEAVAKIRFDGEGGAIEVARRDGGWALVVPKEAPAKRWKVDSILSSLSGLRARRFAPEERARDHGLAPPARSVTLLDGEGKELARLLVGGSDGADALAWVEANGRLAQVERPRLSSLPEGAEELEERQETATSAAAE